MSICFVLVLEESFLDIADTRFVSRCFRYLTPCKYDWTTPDAGAERPIIGAAVLQEKQNIEVMRILSRRRRSIFWRLKMVRYTDIGLLRPPSFSSSNFSRPSCSQYFSSSEIENFCKYFSSNSQTLIPNCGLVCAFYRIDLLGKCSTSILQSDV